MTSDRRMRMVEAREEEREFNTKCLMKKLKLPREVAVRILTDDGTISEEDLDFVIQQSLNMKRAILDRRMYMEKAREEGQKEAREFSIRCLMEKLNLSREAAIELLTDDEEDSGQDKDVFYFGNSN